MAQYIVTVTYRDRGNHGPDSLRAARFTVTASTPRVAINRGIQSVERSEARAEWIVGASVHK